MLLPRIGPSVAQRIVEFRENNGRFKTVEELMLVRGVGEKTFALLKPHIAVSGDTTLTEKVQVPRDPFGGLVDRHRRTRLGRVPASRAGTRQPRLARARQGFQLFEVLIVVTVLLLISAAGLPRVLDWTRRLKVDLAANELVGVLRTARSYAVRYGTKVGVKFRPGSGSGWTFRLYRDGDGDGVRTADIDAGIDPPLGLERQLAHFGSYARFGFPPGPAPRDPGNPERRLDRLHDPIRFNRSDLASFNQFGGSTPGSLYVTDGRYLLSVVRLFGRTGKVKVMRYDPETETWSTE